MYKGDSREERCPVKNAVVIEEGDDEPQDVMHFCNSIDAVTEDGGETIYWVVMHDQPKQLLQVTKEELHELMSERVAII